MVASSCLLTPCQCMHHNAPRSCYVAGNWKTIEGEFNAIMAVVLPCRSDRSDSVRTACLLSSSFVENNAPPAKPLVWNASNVQLGQFRRLLTHIADSSIHRTMVSMASLSYRS